MSSAAIGFFDTFVARQRAKETLMLKYFSKAPSAHAVRKILRLNDFDEESLFTLVESDFPRESEIMGFDDLVKFVLDQCDCSAVATFYDVRREAFWWKVNSRWEFDWSRKTLETARLHGPKAG